VRFDESAFILVSGSASILSVGIHLTVSMSLLWRWSLILSTCNLMAPSSTCLVDLIDSTNDAESVKAWIAAGFS